jgi:uncharacterized membrane protein
MNEQDQTKINWVLSELSALAKNGLITKEQVLSIFETPQTSQPASEKPSKINLQKILYYVGGFIVLAGIVIFIAQFWHDMNQLTKTVVTLGPAVAAYSLGYYFYLKGSKDFGHAFLIISAALFPLGIGTTLDTIGISATHLGGLNINIAVLFLIYFVSYYSLRAAVFLPLTILAASGLFFTFTNYLFENNVPIEHFDQYRIAILGLSWLCFAYYFSTKEMKFMTNIMYFFGLSAFLGSTASLQGYYPKANLFWELAFPFLIILAFYGSIKLQSRVFLVVATLFTIGEILKLTAEYFSEGLGWPISLIIAGLVIMGVSYLSFELNKRFLKPASSLSATSPKT